MAGASHEYNMRHQKRGLALIINNENFSHPQLKRRFGTQVDRDNVMARLKTLHFETECFDDLTAAQMKDTILQVAARDHHTSDCFACVILSHGEEKAVFGTDGLQLDINEFVNPFKGHRCRSLAGKPKLFFIQACRGQDDDEGVVVADALGVTGDGDEVDRPLVTYRIPTEADFLIAYSTVPGFSAFRNTGKGAWFILSLCEVLKEHGTSLDLMTMMTRVNKKVAFEFESNTAYAALNKKKQMPYITSTLTKDVYFPGPRFMKPS